VDGAAGVLITFCPQVTEAAAWLLPLTTCSAGAHAPEESRFLDELMGDPKCREATEIIMQRAHAMNKRRDAYLKNLQKEMGN